MDACEVLEAYAAHLGIPIHDPPFVEYPMWNGSALKRPANAEDWAHEIAHWQLATPERRSLVNYGWGHDAQFGGRDDEDPDKLGPLPWPDPEADWPDTQEEILACMLGFALLVRVGVPAPYDAYSFYVSEWRDEAGRWFDEPVKTLHPDVYSDRREVQSFVEQFKAWRSV